ncbi:hypothetical protein THAOC_04400 [Thalassiosira oceanica]|uniref:Uncharacterized protein n=1 Tax=Thalassiosira oceanica TaxID=159749 RepID=K0TJ78_THAOC|nr:hypothetical protein THAOC_04400 [Thalassiosira oceanica]|eukprot:EJK73956.1 hypothetical protein THAOC_04400 [Thalassiosira oceanica]
MSASQSARIAAAARQIFGTLPNRNVRTGLQDLKKPLTGAYEARFYPEPIEKAAVMSQKACTMVPHLVPATGRASVLSSDAHAPPVAKTTVGPNLLHPLDVVTELGVEVLSENLRVLAGLEVFLPIEEPERDLKLARVLDDGHELLDLVSSEFTGSLVHVDLSLLADKVGESASEALNLGQAEDDVTLTLNVSVENTQDVLKFSSLHH